MSSNFKTILNIVLVSCTVSEDSDKISIGFMRTQLKETQVALENLCKVTTGNDEAFTSVQVHDYIQTVR